MESLAKKKNSDPIPLDVISEILKGFRVKILARFLCVSKQWQSIIRSREFVKSYLIKSSTRPQGLFFTFESKRYGKHLFFSASHPENGGESSSSLVAYHIKYHSKPFTTIAPSVHGLICYGPPYKLRLYNPSTRRTITLPKIDSQRIDIYQHLGYDPVNGDYKVLCMSVGTHMVMGHCLAQNIWVLSLGIGNTWRVIENFPPHYIGYPHSPDISIDGFLYYEASLKVQDLSHAVMSFDVRSESFGLIQVPVPKHIRNPKLTNYKGKLAVVFPSNETKINLWVLEDGAKHEWSKNVYNLPITENRFSLLRPYCATNAGELVLAHGSVLGKSFYVLFYDPEKNTLSRVNIEGIPEPNLTLWDNEFAHDLVSIFSGQVENLMFL